MKEKFGHREAYQSLDTNNKLVCNIREMGHTVRALSDGKASQSRILVILQEEKSITQSELTERLGVQSGSVSEVLGKLERAGLIQRLTSKEDRRTCELSLTEEGITKAIQIKEERENRSEEMFSCLTESEKSELLALLEKVTSDWKRKYSVMHGHGHHGDGPNHSHFKKNF